MTFGEQHRPDTMTADEVSFAESMQNQLREAMNFEGSSEEKQIRAFMATIGLDYDTLTKEEFVSIISGLKKSKYLKSPISQRGKTTMTHGKGKAEEALKQERALRRDEGFYIPLLPFPASRILLLKSPAFVSPRHKPRLSYCREKAFACHTLPYCRVRRQPLSRVSRKQRYNTLDFPTENRVPTGMLRAPIGNPASKGCSL